MSERDEFEKAMGQRLLDDQGKWALSTAHDAAQSYTFLATKWAWEAWQAARAPQAVPALTDEAAMRVALRIMANLEDRKGVLDGVDDDTKADIADEIAVAILAAPQPSPKPKEPR